MRGIAGFVIACALMQAIPAVASEMKAVPAVEQQRSFAQPQVFRGQLGAAAQAARLLHQQGDKQQHQ